VEVGAVTRLHTCAKRSNLRLRRSSTSEFFWAAGGLRPARYSPRTGFVRPELQALPKGHQLLDIEGREWASFAPQSGVRGRPFDPNFAVRAVRPYRTATFAVSMAGKRLGDGRFWGIARLS
jgi:hypothetical protein